MHVDPGAGSPARPLADEAMRMGRWITPAGSGAAAEEARRRGHHRLQIAIDTIAYAHNVPLRLLLPERLADLPRVIADLLREPSVRAVLASDAPEMQAVDHARLGDPALIALARDWILRLPQESIAPPEALPAHWLQGALALLPYIERKVWLTEMGNPLPAHALCRMQDHWSLYVLMWTWKHAESLRRPDTLLTSALEVPGLEVRTLRSFVLYRPDGVEQLCLPVVGPYFVAPEDMDAATDRDAFCDRFECFVGNVVQIDRDRDGRTHTVPLREELKDALGTRIGLTPSEAALRSATTAHTLELLRNARIGDIGFADAMSRADWEVVAALCSWLARWDDVLIPEISDGQQVLLGHNGDVPTLLVDLDADSAIDRRAKPRVRVTIVSRRLAPASALALGSLLRRIDAQHGEATRGAEFDAYRVDRPERYFSRLRERQNSMWSSQVIAINNLLSRHGPRDVYIGADEFAQEDAQGRASVRRDEAEHLLRGFGGRICRYLVSMTRADAAAIYWLDYAQAPPRLFPVGDYARHASHRAQGHDVWEKFDRWAWSPGPELENDCPANQRARSLSQVYRVAATGQEDPPPAAGPGSDDIGRPPRRKRVAPIGPDGAHSVNGGAPGEDTVPAYLLNYAEPRPVDALTAPLLVNGRVIGVVTLLGLVPGQFEPRLFWPLRRTTELIAACMNHQNQVWHMRRLNYLFARRGLHEFQRRGGSPASSPLRDVSRCLANVFLCPAAHIWLQSASNHNRLQLVGYNWDGLFRFDGTPAGFAREFHYTTPAATPKSVAFRPFSSMAIDVARDKGSGINPLGRFVQGHFDAQAPTTSGYDANTASRRGATLGRDFRDAKVGDELDAAARTRARIYGDAGQGGYQLLDIMSFALMIPDPTGWSTVGVVTLHDKGDTRREPLRELQPWDRGWASVVAHMQTYLPYLFRQAEVLNNPEVDARRYLIHAGRAELIAVRDNMTRLRQRLEVALAPGRGLRQMLDKVMSPSFSGDYRETLRSAQLNVADAWEALSLAASPNWEQNLRLLSNVMHEYRELGALPGVSLTAAPERIRIQPLLEETILRFAQEFKHRRSRRIEVPENLELNVPGQWMRIVLRDLVHNAAKYATGDSFIVTWDHDSRTLLLINEGTYQSDLDIPELLLAAGGQGSASKVARQSAADRSSRSDNRGHGLGLWGAKLLCSVMDIDFSIEPKPMSATIKTDGRGVQRGTARYNVRLAFPAAAITSARPAGKSFY
jgi:signal transduction histidine kinase